MKISYKTNWDDWWYVIKQTIRSESEKENKLLKECFTNYTVQQEDNKKLYSIGLSALDGIFYSTQNKRIKNRNTFVLLY